MKVLDLQCDHFHAFEGWFGSESDYQDQLAKRLVACPMCGSTQITKKLSAPRLNLSGASMPTESRPNSNASASSVGEPSAGASADRTNRESQVSAVGDTNRGHHAELHALFLRAVREVVKQTEDVGDKFAEQARRMHYGEQATKPIRGRATAADAMALLEEGIDVLPLPQLPGLNEPLQ